MRDVMAPLALVDEGLGNSSYLVDLGDRRALGEVDPASGGLAPVINPATNYERQPDGSYREDRVCARADNRPSGTLSGCWPRWKTPAGPVPRSLRGWRRPPRSSSPCCPVITCPLVQIAQPLSEATATAFR